MTAKPRMTMRIARYNADGCAEFMLITRIEDDRFSWEELAPCAWIHSGVYGDIDNAVTDGILWLEALGYTEPSATEGIP